MAEARSNINLEPGEFEVLKTKADYGFMKSGVLTLSNYRLFWHPSKRTNAESVEIDLGEVINCSVTRSVIYFFLFPALRVVTRKRRVYDFYLPKELDHAVRSITQFMQRDRYQPGSLFQD